MAITVYTLQEKIDSLEMMLESVSKTMNIIRRQLQDHIADHEAFDVVEVEDSDDRC
jgi:archaellum component FlaC